MTREGLRDARRQWRWPSKVRLGATTESERRMDQLALPKRIDARTRFLPLEPWPGSLPGLRPEGVGRMIAGGESAPERASATCIIDAGIVLR